MKVPAISCAAGLFAAATAHSAVLVSENFEGLSLQPFQSASEAGGDGTDWTPSLPAGWSMLFSGPAGDPVEWQGWRAVDVDSWIATEGNQERSTWSRALIGQHDTVLVADPDAYDDGTNVDTGLFNTWVQTPAISLAGVAANSVIIEFDSFWRNEVTQMGALEASFDGGATWPVTLLSYDSNLFGDGQVIDERPQLAVNNPAAGSLVFRFGLTNGSNDWWWAVDDVVISGTVIPEPSSAAAVALAGLFLARRRR